MTDRHKSKPKAVRMPDGLLARVGKAVEADGGSVNSFIVAAIVEKLDRRESAASPPASPLRTVMPGLPVAIGGACLLPFDHELRLSYKRCGWSSRSLGSVRAMPAELMSDRSVKPGRQSAVKQEPWSVRTGIPVL